MWSNLLSRFKSYWQGLRETEREGGEDKQKQTQRGWSHRPHLLGKPWKYEWYSSTVIQKIWIRVIDFGHSFIPQIWDTHFKKKKIPYYSLWKNFEKMLIIRIHTCGLQTIKSRPLSPCRLYLSAQKAQLKIKSAYLYLCAQK